MSLSSEQLSFYFKEFVQSLKIQISSSNQESQIDVECPPRGNHEFYYGYSITQDFILAFENEIKRFIDPADFYDPTCASLTRNWLMKELRLRQLDCKCCVDLVLEPEDSADEDSEEEVEGLADEKEDDTKTDGDEGGATDHEDIKEDDTKTDEQGSSHYEDKKDDTEADEEADTSHYGVEKDDDTKTDEDTTHFEDEKEDNPKTDEGEGDPAHFEDEEEDDPKTDEDQGDASHYEDEKEDDQKTDEYQGDASHHEDEKEDDPKADEDQGDASQYKDEKDDDRKTDNHEAIVNGHDEDTNEDEDEGYTSHDDKDETSVIGYADDEFEVEYDAQEVVVVISVCSDDPVSFQARPTQAQMDMMTALLCQPPQWWVRSSHF